MLDEVLQLFKNDTTKDITSVIQCAISEIGQSGRLIVISGGQGSGKNVLMQSMLEHIAADHPITMFTTGSLPTANGRIIGFPKPTNMKDLEHLILKSSGYDTFAYSEMDTSQDRDFVKKLLQYGSVICTTNENLPALQQMYAGSCRELSSCKNNTVTWIRIDVNGIVRTITECQTIQYV